MQALVRERPARGLVGVGLVLGGLALAGFWGATRMTRGLERGPAPSAGWGVGAVVAGGALVLVLPRLVLPEKPDPFVGLGVESLAGLAMVGLAVRVAGGRSPLGLVLRPSPGAVLRLLPLVVLVLPLLVFGAFCTALVYELHGLQVVPQDVAGALEKWRGTWRYYAILGFILLLAPLFEECLYRGLLFGLLRRHLGAGWSIGLSALIFGLIHDPVSILGTFAAGLILGLVRERSGSLGAPLCLHALFNLSMFAMGAPSGSN